MTDWISIRAYAIPHPVSLLAGSVPWSSILGAWPHAWPRLSLYGHHPRDHAAGGLHLAAGVSGHRH